MAVHNSHIRSDYYDDYSNIFIIVFGVGHNGTNIRQIVFIFHHNNVSGTAHKHSERVSSVNKRV